MACEQADKLKLRPQELVIILDDLDFSWTKEEMREAIKMYKAGAKIDLMAKVLRPKDKLCNAIDEVALLIMHLARQDLI